MKKAELQELADDLGLENDGMLKAELKEKVLEYLADEVPF